MLLASKLDDVIKPHMKEEYEKDKYNRFPNETTKELKAYNERTPGLSSRIRRKFYVEGENKKKYSCKGIQKNQREINK